MDLSWKMRLIVLIGVVATVGCEETNYSRLCEQQTPNMSSAMERDVLLLECDTLESRDHVLAWLYGLEVAPLKPLSREDVGDLPEGVSVRKQPYGDDIVLSHPKLSGLDSTLPASLFFVFSWVPVLAEERPGAVERDGQLMYQVPTSGKFEPLPPPRIDEESSFWVATRVSANRVAVGEGSHDPEITRSEVDGTLQLSFALSETATRQFHELTSEQVGKRIAFINSERLLSSPVVREPIPGGRIQLSFPFGAFDEPALQPGYTVVR